MNPDELLTLGQVADRVGIHFWQLTYMFKRGRLTPRMKIGHCRVMRADDLDEVRQAAERCGYIKPAMPELAVAG